jgi:hypothetical protein
VDGTGAELKATADGTVASVDLTVGEQSRAAAREERTARERQRVRRSSSNLGNGSTARNGNGAASSDSSATSFAQITVVSTGSYTTTVNLDDTDIGKIQNGQTVNVSLSSGTSSGLRRVPGGLRSQVAEQQQATGGTSPTASATRPAHRHRDIGRTGRRCLERRRQVSGRRSFTDSSGTLTPAPP